MAVASATVVVARKSSRRNGMGMTMGFAVKRIDDAAPAQEVSDDRQDGEQTLHGPECTDRRRSGSIADARFELPEQRAFGEALWLTFLSVAQRRRDTGFSQQRSAIAREVRLASASLVT
jgi:hypothetical protein